jgi:transporter family protein
MLYIVLTVISSAFLSLYDLFKKISIRNKKDIYEILFFYTFIAFVCSLFYFRDAFSINLKYIGFILVKSCIISLSWFFTMRAVSKLDLGVVTPFSMLGTIFTTILAWIFFGENIGLIQIGGIVIILMGLFLLARLDNKEKKENNDYRYLLLLVISAFLSSISAIIDKKVLTVISKGAVLFWFFFFLTFIYFVICLIKNKKVNISNFKTNLWIIGIGVSIFLADLFYYQAVAIDNVSVSIVSIIRKISVFFSVVLAGVFLKEGNLLKKIMILILMFIGLTFIILV